MQQFDNLTNAIPAKSYKFNYPSQSTYIVLSTYIPYQLPFANCQLISADPLNDDK
jgi:hypothetical protein